MEFLLVIHNFEGRSADEVSLRKGDHVQVIEDDSKYGDGWYIGLNLMTQQTGLFPRVFTTDLITPNPGTAGVQRSPRRSNTDLRFSSTNANNHIHHSVYETVNDIDQAISEFSSYAHTEPQSAHSEVLDAIRRWSPTEVMHYFDSRGFDPAITHQFVRHNISGDILLQLDLAYLKEIDIVSFGTRFEIFKEIKSLLNQADIPAGTSGGPADLATPPSFNMDKPLPDSPRRSQTSVSFSPTLASPTFSSSSSSLPSMHTEATSSKSGPKPNRRSMYRPAGATAAGMPISPGSPVLHHLRQPSRDTVRARASTVSGSVNAHTQESSPRLRSNSYAPLDLQSPTKSLNGSDLTTEYVDTPTSARSVTARADDGEDFAGSALTTPVDEVDDDDDDDEDDDDDGPESASSPDRRFFSGSALPDVTRAKTVKEKESSPDGDSRMPMMRSKSSSAATAPTRKLQKQQTSAFQEGLQEVTAEKSAATADFSGWLYKRSGGGMGTWRRRFFALHGTRLSYFASMDDTREKGLIDMTSHRCTPARDDDKLVALMAAGMGASRHCFKLTPPAPGSRKGVTFTAPRVHFFAADNSQQMRAWVAALTKATIERDETAEVLSSCHTPTVSLPRAQEMFSGEARAVATTSQTGSTRSDRDSAESPTTTVTSLRSSQTTGSDGASLRMHQSPQDFSAMLNGGLDTRHLTAKTAGLRIVTDLEEPVPSYSL